MLWYNNPDAVQAVHNQIVREHHQEAQQRRLLRVISSEAPEATPII